MSSELLLAAVVIGSLGAVVVLAAVLGDIRVPKKRKADKDTESEQPRAA